MFYLSCPDCRKKVTEHGDKWRCENCNKVYPTNIPTYMLSAVISDSTGSILVQFPREMGDAIMKGVSAGEFKLIKEKEGWREHINKCLFKEY